MTVRSALGEAWGWQHGSVNGEACSNPWHGDVCATPAEASGIVLGILWCLWTWCILLISSAGHRIQNCQILNHFPKMCRESIGFLLFATPHLPWLLLLCRQHLLLCKALALLWLFCACQADLGMQLEQPDPVCLSCRIQEHLQLGILLFPAENLGICI